ncbi:MAG: class C sortase [Microbacteriaceae bacterium]
MQEHPAHDPAETTSHDADRAALPIPARARRWQMPWLNFVACVVVIVGVGVFLYPHIASWFSQKEQSRVTEIALKQLDQPPNNDPDFTAAEVERAREYNDALMSGAMLEAGGNIPVGGAGAAGGADSDAGAQSENAHLEYESMLDPTGSGFMGRLKYNALDIDLPIYHGTEDETLLKGVGHLEGTSLPVGGEGNRSVLTAHRGLPTATLFNELDRGKKGDIISVTVLDSVYSYRVIDTQVISPEKTEAILPVDGEDLLTLVTCTPLGINSHRILVTAERITPTPPGEAKSSMSTPELPGFPWWIIAAGASIIIAGAYVWRTGRVAVPAGAGAGATGAATTGAETTDGAEPAGTGPDENAAPETRVRGRHRR